METMLVEIIVRRNMREISNKLPETIVQFMVFETPEKVVFNVPGNWVGFRDGSIVNMLKEFGESTYAALAYFCQNDEELLTDFEGIALDEYDVTLGGKRYKKYVKKRIQIQKFLDKEKDQFTVKRFLLDLRSTNPIILVLDVYSTGGDGGIKSEYFMGNQN